MARQHTLDIIFTIDEAMAAGRNDEAAALCRRLLARRDVDESVLSRLSVSTARQGKRDESMRWFRAGAVWNPGSPEALNNLGHAHEIAGDDHAIATTFGWLRCLAPKKSDIAERQGDALRRSGDSGAGFAAYMAAFRGGSATAKQSYKLFDTLRAARGASSTPVFFSRPTPVRTALVTAADEGYARYLRGLLTSFLKHAGPCPPRICVLDLGLGEETLAWLKRWDALVVAPGWDLAFANRDKTPETFKALTARPFLPEHFPGHDLYLWMDADTWVQDARWFDDMLFSALLGRLAVVPELSPTYLRQYRTIGDREGRIDEYTWRRRAYALCYDDATAEALADHPTLNSGVFALRADAPHWLAWRESLEAALRNIQYPLVEQTAFNHAVYTNRLPTAPLAASANWQVHRRLPLVDPRGDLLCEPFTPHDPLGIIHVTGPDKERRHALRRLDGTSVSRTLLYEP